MVSKTCTECKKASYSAAESGEWLCPYCEADLTDQKIETKEV